MDFQITANRNKLRILLCYNLGLFLWKRKDDSEGRTKSTEPGVIENCSQGVGLDWAIIKKVVLAWARWQTEEEGRNRTVKETSTSLISYDFIVFGQERIF